jgi:hypothetical protein
LRVFCLCLLSSRVYRCASPYLANNINDSLREEKKRAGISVGFKGGKLRINLTIWLIKI